MKPSETPPPPDWTRAKSLFAELKTSARRTVALQVLIGRELTSIKKALGFTHGRNQWIGHGVRSTKTWEQWCEDELGVSCRTADRWIGCFIAAKERAKRRKDSEALALLEADPASLYESQIVLLADCVHRLVAPPEQNMPATTQWQLLEEIGLVSRQKLQRPDGKKNGDTKPEELAAEIRIKCLFEEVKGGLSAARRVLHTAAHGDKVFMQALEKLHLASSDPGQVTLQQLKDGFEEFQERIIPEIARDLEATTHNVRAFLKAVHEVEEKKMNPVSVRRPRKNTKLAKP